MNPIHYKALNTDIRTLPVYLLSTPKFAIVYRSLSLAFIPLLRQEMATCNQNDGSWLPSNPSEEGLEAYPHLVSSTQSTASDLSSSLARADVSPFSLNGTISSRGTSPASSTGSYKVRRSSEAFECDNDTTESQILPASKRPKHNGPSPAHESSVGAELSQTKTQVCKQNLLKLPNCPLRMSRTLFVENLVGMYMRYVLIHYRCGRGDNFVHLGPLLA